jgi:iron only hydrogenase large subunit-like protein
MVELKHGFKISADKCNGLMRCMRACPTHAIRVQNGKARLIPELCIDCGGCLSACPSGAISATTVTFAELDRFKFKVAVAAPALFTQFGLNDTPAQVEQALLGLGFDAVWEYAVDIELIDRAIAECVGRRTGPFPLISNSCPVVVRLVQVAYPTMVDQLIPIEAPREIAGRELKRKYSQELNLKPEEIAAVYITPCQAKTLSILQPAEGVESFLDGAVGISQIYNDLFFHLRKKTVKEEPSKSRDRSTKLFHWGSPEGEFARLSREKCLTLEGLTDIIKVFDDVEKGRITNIDFLECHACQSGCIGGNLTVENPYVARGKNIHLISQRPIFVPEYEKEVARRYATEDLSLRASIKPRAVESAVINLHEQVSRRKKTEAFMKVLPLLNCGLCGAPSCKSHAEDVAATRAEMIDCVFLSPERIERLRKIYKKL